MQRHLLISTLLIPPHREYALVPADLNATTKVFTLQMLRGVLCAFYKNGGPLPITLPKKQFSIDCHDPLLAKTIGENIDGQTNTTCRTRFYFGSVYSLWRWGTYIFCMLLTLSKQWSEREQSEFLDFIFHYHFVLSDKRLAFNTCALYCSVVKATLYTTTTGTTQFLSYKNDTALSRTVLFGMNECKDIFTIHVFLRFLRSTLCLVKSWLRHQSARPPMHRGIVHLKMGDNCRPWYLYRDGICQVLLSNWTNKL